MSRVSRRVVIAVVLFLMAAATGFAVADFLSNSVPVSGPVPVVAPNGPNATLTGQADVNLTDPWPDDNTVVLNTSEGNVTFSSSSRTNLSIAATEINGTWTNVSQLDVSGTTLTVQPEDKQEFRIEGSATAISFRSVMVDDGTVDFVLVGPGSERSDVTITGLSANTEYTAIDMSSGTAAGQAQSDGSGVVTMSVEASGNPMRLVTGDQTNAPVQSNAGPQGGVSTEPSKLSADINDSDFPTDDVDVTISLDGSQIHSETVSSNGTVTTSNFGELDLGVHTWTVNATDDYGNSDNQTYTFELPQNITIRDETPPHNKLTGCNAEVTFYEDEEDDPFIANRSDSDGDGNISLEGLPAQSQFAATINCDGFHNRTVLIDSIFDQQTVFLINTSETTVENRFTITDFTNRYPPDSAEIVIQKAINRSLYDPSLTGNNFTWLNVAGDDIGADQAFTTDLIENDRYRLRVQNDAGDSRILGAYIPTTSGTIDLTVGAVDVEYTDSDENIAWSFNQTNETNIERLQFTYSDPQGNTSSVDVLIYERGNDSNVIEDTTFDSGPYGNLTLTKNLTMLGETGKEWVVEFNASRGDGFIAGKAFTNPAVTVQLPNLDEDWRHIIAVLSLIIVGGIFSQANVDIGAVAVSGLAGIFWTTGFLNGVTSGAAIAVAIGLALFYKWATREPVT